MKKLTWVLFFFAAFAFKASAQCSFCADCVDSTRMNPFADCGDLYSPYCGCDGKWYRNECSAYQQNGVNCPSTGEACCPPLHFMLLPNIVVAESINFQIYLRNGIDAFVNIRLIDSYGKLKQSYNVFTTGGIPRAVPIDAQTLRPGVYYIFVEAEGMTLWEKFVKV